MIERIVLILMDVLLNIKVGMPYEEILKLLLNNGNLSAMLITMLLLKNIIQIHIKNI